MKNLKLIARLYVSSLYASGWIYQLSQPAMEWDRIIVSSILLFVVLCVTE